MDPTKSNPPRESKYLKAFLLYIVALAFFHFPVIFAGKSMQPALLQPYGFTAGWPYGYEGRIPVNTFDIDMATPAYYEWPVNKLTGDLYKKGELPLWNPYQAAGTPLLAQYSTRVLFPYQVLEDMSPASLWDFFLLGRPLVAGFLTFMFLARLGLSFSPAFLGGLFYMFSGSFTWFLTLEQYANCAMALPGYLLALELLLERRKGALAVAGAATGLVLIAGQPETALLALTLGAVFFIVRAAVIKKGGPGLFLKYALSSVLGLALAAPVILPFLELTQNAFHIHEAGSGISMRDPLKPYGLMQIMTPYEIERRDPNTMTAEAAPAGEFYFRVLPESGQWDYLGGYMGISAIALTALGVLLLLRSGERMPYRPVAIYFAVFGAVIILKNLGLPPFSWIGHLPLFDQVWTQRWAGPVWVFAFAVSGAIGFQAISDRMRGDGGSVKASSLLAAFIAMLALYAFSVAAFFTEMASVIERMAPGTGFIEGLRYLGSLDPHLFYSICPNIAVTAATLITLYAMIMLSGKRKGKGIEAVVLLAAFELWWAVPRAYDNHTLVWKLLLIIPALLAVGFLFRGRKAVAAFSLVVFITGFAALDHLAANGLPERISPFTEPPFVRFLQSKVKQERVVASGGLLFPNYAGAAGLQDVRYINSLAVNTYNSFRNRFLEKEENQFRALWFTGKDFSPDGPFMEESLAANLPYYSFLGVRYIVSRPGYPLAIGTERMGMDFLNRVYDGSDAVVFENPYAMPRAFMAGAVVKAGGYKEAQDMIDRPGFDLRTAVIEGEQPQWARADSTGPAGTAEITEYGANSVSIRADTPAGGLLVLTDVFYPGWRAFVDGREENVYRVDGLVRGVFLGKGPHMVEFRYRPASFRAGMVIFFIAVSLITVSVIADLKPGKNADLSCKNRAKP